MFTAKALLDGVRVQTRCAAGIAGCSARSSKPQEKRRAFPGCVDLAPLRFA